MRQPRPCAASSGRPYGIEALLDRARQVADCGVLMARQGDEDERGE